MKRAFILLFVLLPFGLSADDDYNDDVESENSRIFNMIQNYSDGVSKSGNYKIIKKISSPYKSDLEYYFLTEMSYKNPKDKPVILSVILVEGGGVISSIHVGEFGRYGDYSGPISLVELGRDKIGFDIETGFVNMGQMAVTANIYEVTDGEAIKVFTGTSYAVGDINQTHEFSHTGDINAKGFYKDLHIAIKNDGKLVGNVDLKFEYDKYAISKDSNNLMKDN